MLWCSPPGEGAPGTSSGDASVARTTSRCCDRLWTSFDPPRCCPDWVTPERRPVICGRREHNCVRYPGNWEPIISQEDQVLVNRVLVSNRRQRPGDRPPDPAS